MPVGNKLDHGFLEEDINNYIISGFRKLFMFFVNLSRLSSVIVPVYDIQTTKHSR